mmetsp:Transcript_17252/g.22570  ORF Transcript_17252/g.22570 Transcript_17252/m.22570 type:complete len:588 (+) Transcript_17252:225-1988(+)
MSFWRKFRNAGLAVSLLSGGSAFAFVAADEERRKALPRNLDGTWRFLRTSFNVFVTAADYKYSLYGMTKAENPKEWKENLTAANLRAAKRLYRVCHSHGGLYNKFAQYVSTMNHVLPDEVVHTLAPLQDKAKEISPELAAKCIIEELGVNDLNEVFLEFDELPIAAASLAQVHRARLKNGSEVAVKIQYPHLREQTTGDVATMKMLTQFIGAVFPDFEYSWLVKRFEDTIILEMDFEQEAKNAKRLGQMFQHRSDVYVPAVFDDMTTGRLLVMEFVRGLKPSDKEGLLKEGFPMKDVARTVSAIFGDMIHVHGFIHCDPHAGNLLVRKNPKEKRAWSQFFTVAGLLSTPIFAVSGLYSAAAVAAALFGSTAMYFQESSVPYQLVVLDHGMYRRLDPEFRRLYCELWESLLLRDHGKGRKTAINLGVSSADYDILSLIITYRSPGQKHKMGGQMSKEQRKKLKERFKDVTHGEVNAFMKRLPRDMLFVSRTTNIVRSLNKGLGGSTRERFKIMGESAVRGLTLTNSQRLQDTIETLEKQKEYSGAYGINLPVASEIESPQKPISERIEVYRLRFYLEIVDRLLMLWGL